MASRSAKRAHRQLGLPELQLQEADRPAVPFVRHDDQFRVAVRGDFANSLRANFAGTVLALIGDAVHSVEPVVDLARTVAGGSPTGTLADSTRLRLVALMLIRWAAFARVDEVFRIDTKEGMMAARKSDLFLRNVTILLGLACLAIGCGPSSLAYLFLPFGGRSGGAQVQTGKRGQGNQGRHRLALREPGGAPRRAAGRSGTGRRPRQRASQAPSSSTRKK